jgi:hypothetical protein
MRILERPKPNLNSLKRSYKYVRPIFFGLIIKIWKHRIINFFDLIRKYHSRIIVTLFLFLAFFIPVELKNGKLQSFKKRLLNENTVHKKDDVERFLDKLSKFESGGSYTIVNYAGFMGKYQIGRQALKAIDMGGIPDSIFLKTPELQEVAVRLLLKLDKRIMSPYIKKYNGKEIGGINITISGLIGGCHMSPRGVITFLESNGDSIFKDGNGVPITKYIKEFSGYNLKSI